MTRESSADRNHGMDAIRAVALLAGIGLHSTLSFLPGVRMIGMTVADCSQSLTLSTAFFFVHMFRMPLFFLIAGYFAHMLIKRKGLRQFAHNRAMRIGVPLVVSWFVGYPLLVLCAVWSAAKLGTLLTRPELGPQPTLLRFPLMHLWFLHVLIQFYLVTIIACWIGRYAQRAERQQHDDLRTGAHRLQRSVSVIVGSPWAPLVASLLVGSILLLIPEWIYWFGVPTPDRSLLTHPAALSIYGLYYLVGWVAYAEPKVLQNWQRDAALHTCLGLGCYVACLTLVGVTPQLHAATAEPQMFVYALMYSLGQWCLVTASMGWGLRLFARPTPQLRYLSDASYWMYLAHLPIVVMVQVLIMQWDLHWSVKFTLVNVVTIAVLLLAYEWAVRNKWKWSWLFGVNPTHVKRVPTTRYWPHNR